MLPELQRAVSNITVRKPIEERLTPLAKSNMTLELAMMIFRGAPVAATSTIFVALATIMVGWGLVDHGVLWGWGSAVILLSLARLIHWQITRRKRLTLSVMGRFKNHTVFLMMLNGALWGMLAPIFAIYGQIGNVFLPFVLAGMTAATIVWAGACWRCVMAFNIPALLPMAIAFFFWGGEGGHLISVVIIIYALMTSIGAWQSGRTIKRAVLLRKRNAFLSQALETKEEKISEAGKRFQAMIESSRELTLIFSPAGNVTYASPSAQDVLGYSEGAFMSLTSRQLVHEDDLPQFRAIGEKTLSGIGEVHLLSHICMLSHSGDYVPLTGRLANFLYVPGIEGFVFTGLPLSDIVSSQLHAAE